MNFTKHLRTLLLATLLPVAGLLSAQPYSVTISGHVSPCNPSIANGAVLIQTIQGTQPEISLTVALNPNCYYITTVQMEDSVGWFQVSVPCANGAMAMNTGQYGIDNPNGSTSLTIDLDCSNTTTDCLGVVGGSALPGTPCTTPVGGIGTWSNNCTCVVSNTTDCLGVVGGSALPGTACTDSTTWLNGTWSNNCICVVDSNAVDCLGIVDGPNMPGTPCTATNTGVTGTWNNDCACIPDNVAPCQAGFWVLQAYTPGDSTNTPGGAPVEPIPFQLWIWNLSSGGTGNYQFLWDFGDGNTSTEAFPTHTYAGAGPYELCLTIADDAGCTSTYCETIEVDEDGLLGMAPGHDVRSQLTINVVQEMPTGIAERTELEAANLWPNPVQDRFTMQVNSSRAGNLEVGILDLNGREVYRGSVAVMAGSNRMDLNVEHLESGLYLLRITSGRQASVLRFVKH